MLRAREDPYAFALLVGRTDQGIPIRSTAIHAAWHKLLSDNEKVVLWAPVGHAKTTQISRWRVVWEIGRNPNLRVGIISSAKGAMPLKILGGIKQEITSNPLVKLVFPHLRPATRADPQSKWSDTAITVARDPGIPMNDPTIQTFGAPGEILGSRLDLVLVDDVHSQENVLTEQSRNKIWDFISGPVMSRAPPQGGRFWAVGHTWHKDDVLHRLVQIAGFATSPKYSAFVPDPQGRRDEKGHLLEVPLMPEMWSITELRSRERMMRTALSKLMLRNTLVAPEDQRINEDWIIRCMRLGMGTPLAPFWNPADAPTFTGVDLSVASSDGGDLACLFTIAILPDGSRRILDIRSGRWTGPRILKEIIDVYQRYGSIIAVENNAAQDYLLQFAGELTALPLKRHTTGTNKHHVAFGVESIGTELEQSKWIIPCGPDLAPHVDADGHSEIAAWANELTSYTPKEHTGDRLMASWIAREAARQCGMSHGTWNTQDDSFMDPDTLWRGMR